MGTPVNITASSQAPTTTRPRPPVRANHRLAEFVCIDCGCKSATSLSMAGRVVRCPPCQVRYRNVERRKRSDRYPNGRASMVAQVGGPYRVVFDPLDSFTPRASFTRSELDDMLKLEYLADGTRFAHVNGHEYHVICGRLYRMGAQG